MIDVKKLDRVLLSVEKPARYVGSELNSVVKNKDIDIRFVFAFPDIYEVGMLSLIHICLYLSALLNQQNLPKLSNNFFVFL